MPTSARDEPWLTHPLDPGFSESSLGYSYSTFPEPGALGIAPRQKSACLQPYTLSWAEQPTPAACHSSAVLTDAAGPNTAIVAEVRLAVVADILVGGGGGEEEVAEVIAPHSPASQEAEWVSVVPHKQSGPYSTEWLRCCWASQAPRADAYWLHSADLPWGSLCSCSPPCLTSECPRAFSQNNTVSYPSTLTFINPRWNTVEGGIKPAW